jgi:hypothetical protein
MRKTKRNRGLFLTGAAATAIALMGTPHDADAKPRRQIDKSGDVQPGDRVTAGPKGLGPEAPEIDPSALGHGVALAAGALAVLASRRRKRTTPAQ